MKSIIIESISNNFDFDQPIKGTAVLEIEGRSPITVKDFTISFYGEYSTVFKREEQSFETRMKMNPTTKEFEPQTITVKKEIVVPKKTIFYKPPTQQVASAKTYNGYVELTPGIHRFPISYQIEQDGLPSTTIFQNHKYSLKYFAFVSVVDSDNNKKESESYQIPLCYRSNPLTFIPLQLTKRFSDDSAKIELTLNTWRPSCGNTLSVKVNCINKQICALEIYLYIRTIMYSESRISDLKDTEYIEETTPVQIGSIPSRSTKEISALFEIPITLQSVVYNREFNVFHQLIVKTKKFLSQDKEIPFDIDINCTVPDESDQHRRMVMYTVNDSVSLSHYQQPIDLPNYEDIVDSELLAGVEKILPFDEQSQPFYVNHFNRLTSCYPDRIENCGKDYPFYESLVLPPGWCTGIISGQRFFIDHNNRTTTWDDPRSAEELFLPHSKGNINSYFTIEIIETKGLIKKGLIPEKLYVAIVNEKKKWISSKFLENGIQEEKKRKELSINLKDERVNVCVQFFKYHLFFKDTFKGEINLDLMYIPQNTYIQNWFDVKSNENSQSKVIGQVLMKICYHVGTVEEKNTITVEGYSPLLKF